MREAKHLGIGPQDKKSARIAIYKSSKQLFFHSEQTPSAQPGSNDSDAQSSLTFVKPPR